MVKMQIDITEEIDKEISILKIKMGLKTKQEVISDILDKKFKKKIINKLLKQD